MTDWKPIEEFKQKKNTYYLLYHPSLPAHRGGKYQQKEYITVDNCLPSYPRKPTLYAEVILPTKEQQRGGSNNGNA